MKKWSLLFFVFLYGCAAHFTVPSEEALKQPFPPLTESVKTNLYLPSFSNASLKGEGLAIFGILKGGPEGLRQNAAFELFQGLRAVFPDGRIIPRKDLVHRARVAGRKDELNDLLNDYEERRVLDVAALKRWQAIEGVRYFFIAQVPLNDKHTSGEMMQLGEDGVAGKVYTFSSGPSPILLTVEKQITLRGEVWDAKCGKVVWMGESHAEIIEPVKLERVRVEDLFTALTRNLLSEMDRRMVAGGASPVSTTDCSFN